jgi:hypothetical protein
MTYYNKYSKYKTKYKELITLVQEGGEDLQRVFNLNIIKTTPSMNYIKSTFTPNYKGNPLSDHGALKYENIVIWNITQLGHKIILQNRENNKSSESKIDSEEKTDNTTTEKTNDTTTEKTNDTTTEKTDTTTEKTDNTTTEKTTESNDSDSSQPYYYTHKFMNIKNETEEQYKRRCYKIKHKIFDIISKNPDIDVLLLQELPSNVRGDIFHKNMRLEIGNNIYVLLCNYDIVSWPNGIIYNSTKFSAKQVFPPEGSSNEEYNRIGIFVLTEHGQKNSKVYISVHFLFKKDKNRDQELVKLMDELVKNLIRTLPHNITEVIFGGDFNTGFKSGLFSEFKDVRLYTLPQFEVYSTNNNFGRRNEFNIDYVIVYKLF